VSDYVKRILLQTHRINAGQWAYSNVTEENVSQQKLICKFMENVIISMACIGVKTVGRGSCENLPDPLTWPDSYLWNRDRNYYKQIWRRWILSLVVTFQLLLCSA